MLSLGLALSSFFIVQVFFLCLLNQILVKTHKCQAKKYLLAHPFLFFYNKIYDQCFPHKHAFGVFLSCVYGKNIARFAFGLSSLLFIFALERFKVSWAGLPFILLGLLLLYLFLSDFLPRLFSVPHAEKVFLWGALLVSFYQTLLLPLLVVFLKITFYFQKKHSSSKEHKLFMREKLYDLIQETWPEQHIDAKDKKLFESILKFKSRIVREVMVPRADVFAIDSATPIKEIIKTLFEENYSRIPVYKNTLDNVVGILFYKDLLSLYITSTSHQDPTLLEQTVESLMKKPLYTPETTRISILLQEFLHNQQHLALVVDEFGSVEGLVTIEDILEEIVGEIEDEYDEEERILITPQVNGWLVDAKMSLHEIEETTKLKIPHHGEYDSIGGYVIHRAGKIPPVGLRISLDDFEIEVIEATDRQINKVRIVPNSPLLKS